jgi:tellurite methyltransferase
MKEKHYFENEVYSKEHVFKFEADKELLESILKIKKKGKILDLGCGEGGNSLSLASKGFNVTCIDISQKAIDAIKSESEKRILKLNAVCADIEKYKIDENYDIILLTGILHLVDKIKVKKIIELAKKRTCNNGLDIVDVFLDGSACQAGSEGHFFKKGEILGYFDGWKVAKNEIYDEMGNRSQIVIFKKV